MSGTSRRRFNRDRLPQPKVFFDSIGLNLIGNGVWRSAVCPFHDDSKPSLRVHFESGAFRCMTCGTHGGDVLAFHVQRTGKGFVQAARELGAWDGRR
jgi:DNA primase